MTDNEIIANEILCIRRRASGRCNGGADCNTCDLLMNETEIIKAYQRAMKQNDLINRQKAEILELQKRIINWRADMDYRPDEIKSEAIKEFAQRLKKYLCLDFREGISVVTIDDIDNLVKEMTEVQK